MTDYRTISVEGEPASYARGASRSVGMWSRARLVLGVAIGLTLFGLLYGVQKRYL